MRRTRVAPDGPAPSLTHRGRAMQQDSAIFVGLDTSKMKVSVALAEDERYGKVRFLGDIENTPEAVRRLVMKLAGKSCRLMFCYEAGPTLRIASADHRPGARLRRPCPLTEPEAAGRARQDQS